MSSDPSSKDQSRFFCHCGKSFIRKEHLRRHESSHAKPAFVCQVCQKSFTRNDLLRRHATLHGAKEAPTPRRSKACNACHESKVKCEGGERCSLCVKRGIVCSYDRDLKSDQIDESHNGPDPHVSPPDSELAENSRRDRDEAERGLRTVISLLKNGHKVPTRVGLPAELQEVGEWWERCSDTYRLGFHNHWTVLHYPTIQDFPRNTIWLEATIAMVATWATHGPRSTLREQMLEIHDSLMTTCLSELTASAAENDVRDRPWLWPLWKIALINVVFAMETGEMNLIRRADHVFDMLVSDCQRRGAFDPQSIARHQKLHEPGEFPPWVFKNTEQFHKMAAIMLKIDACLCLIGDRSPRIRGEELGSRLPVPFTIWNSYGLGQHFERAPHQPRELEQYSISQLLQISHVDIPLFYEDIQLILSAAIQSSRQVAQAQQQGVHVDLVAAKQRHAFTADRLELCEKRLHCLHHAVRPNTTDPDTRRLLLWTYTGKEEPEDKSSPELVVSRLVCIDKSTSLMESLARMNLHADVRMLGTRMTQSQTNSPESLRTSPTVLAWADSPTGRMALLDAMAALIHFEKGSPDNDAAHVDIIGALAMTSAAIILYSWLGCIQHDAESQEWSSGQATLSLDYIRSGPVAPPPCMITSWIESGGPVTAIDGWQLSKRMYSQHMTTLLSKLKPVRDTWPLCEPFAVALEAQI
ncbi:fungal zn(2)-Cys(6) binuclear cluster domain-containing protein [Sarocladium implicatum]|nr:fungal zn(2)-Cys(6) binuclear cluster domain-containing protein [Sarocladium implicatum]